MNKRLRMRKWWVHAAAGLALAAFVAALYYPLLFTNRVLATGDILLYFYPYRDYVAAALREGRLPLWNPYLFGGAPLLANPQAAVLYPLHWPLVWLSPTQQVYWSAAIHTWLLGAGGYWLLRRWGGNAWAGLATALVLSGAGLVGGLMGHLNQLNVAAWSLWAVACVEGAGFSTPQQRYGVVGRALLLAIVTALMLLAGHTQTIYMILFALGGWSLWPLWERQARETVARETGARLAVYTLGIGLGALLSAPQLLPTWELSGLGLRTGGLNFIDATSFSLKPAALAWTLLPSYGLVSLEAVFDTPAYTEFVAYVGLIGLALALLGGWQGRGRARAFGLFLVALGLLLGLGRWNPLYFLLHSFVPGFDLFRVPARWLLLYTLGAGVLAGLGMQWLAGRLKGWLAGARSQAGWGWIRWVQPLLLLALALELLAAARSLPHTQPTAPEAVDGLRSAPAHLLTDPSRQGVDPAATGRFLGLSTITFDPGDMADYRRIMLEEPPAQLAQGTFDDLVIAQKVQELLVPNLALLWRIPTIDGFDGGVLPLQRFNQFAQLLIPPDSFGPDGRLREQLRDLPPVNLLNLMNVQYLITDKVRDLWFEDVYYDRQVGARLNSRRPALQIPTAETADTTLQTTHLDLIAYADAEDAVWRTLANDALPIAAVTVQSREGLSQTLQLTAGGAAGALLAGSALDDPLAQSSGATVAWRDGEAGRQAYRLRLPLAQPQTPTTITLQLLDPRFAVMVQAATLYDQRTHMFAALLPSDKGRFGRVHSGDVKIYANQELWPRAYIVTQTLAADSPRQAVELLQTALADPAGSGALTVAEGLPALTGTGSAGSGAGAPSGTVEIVDYTAEQVTLRTSSAAPGLLVLADAYYPGWRAAVDGQETPIYPTNVLFRGVPLPAGEHTVVFTFAPSHWRLALALALLGLLLMAVLDTVVYWGFRRQRRNGV